MNIAELRAFMADIRTRQAKLDAQMLEANARMISLMHDPVAPTFVIPERELVAHGGLTSREAREVVSRGLVTEVAPEMGAVLASGDTTAAHVDALGRGLKIAGAERDAFLSHLPELVVVVHGVANSCLFDGAGPVHEIFLQSIFLHTHLFHQLHLHAQHRHVRQFTVWINRLRPRQSDRLGRTFLGQWKRCRGWKYRCSTKMWYNVS